MRWHALIYVSLHDGTFISFSGIVATRVHVHVVVNFSLNSEPCSVVNYVSLRLSGNLCLKFEHPLL